MRVPEERAAREGEEGREERRGERGERRGKREEETVYELCCSWITGNKSLEGRQDLMELENTYIHNIHIGFHSLVRTHTHTHTHTNLRIHTRR